MFSEKNYYVDFNKRIGRGATADVFIGITKDHGEERALKYSSQQLVKEIDVSKQLNHKNIVKYYENFKTKVELYQQVLVMEYCNHGSLFDFIDAHGGLCDNMLLITLDCLYESMSYLRSKQLIHRDIKPGNMMVHMDSMGSLIVKLGDMGTAKMVRDDQQFQTLVGTVEYLDPHMFNRYIDKVDDVHNAAVDLWSIGVTLYHASVNELPFLPYNYGRASDDSSKTLQNMYDTMLEGVIGGKQNSQNRGDITWIHKLPDKCRMSPMLKDLVTELIAMLFNRKETVEKAFENFFSLAKRILSKKRILVFNPNDEKLQFLYLDDLYYETILNETVNILGSSRDSLILLTKCKLLKSTPGYEVVKSFPVKGHLRYKLTDDTVFIIQSNMTINDPTNPTQQFPDIKEIIEPSKKQTSRQLPDKESTRIMRGIHEIHRTSNYVFCQTDCYKAAIESYLEQLIHVPMRRLYITIPIQVQMINYSCDNLSTAYQLYNMMPSSQSEQYQSIDNEVEHVKKKAMDGYTVMNQYYNELLENQEFSKYTLNIISSIWEDDDSDKVNLKIDHLDHLVHLAEEIMNEIKIFKPDQYKDDENYFVLIWKRLNDQYCYFKDASELLSRQYKILTKYRNKYFEWIIVANGVRKRLFDLNNYFITQEDRKKCLDAKYSKLMKDVIEFAKKE